MPTGQRIDWAAVPELGQISDEAIALRLGCTPERVARARCERGMWKRPSGGLKSAIDWRRVEGLGVESDQVVGDRLGVSRQSVLRARERLGIPASSRRSTMLSLPTDVYHAARAMHPKMRPHDALVQIIWDAVLEKKKQRKKAG